MPPAPIRLPTCRSSRSYPTASPIYAEVAAVAAASARCASSYLDTVEGTSNDVFSTEGECQGWPPGKHRTPVRSGHLASG
jgi:hypothetical protein